MWHHDRLKLTVNPVGALRVWDVKTATQWRGLTRSPPSTDVHRYDLRSRSGSLWIPVHHLRQSPVERWALFSVILHQRSLLQDFEPPVQTQIWFPLTAIDVKRWPGLLWLKPSVVHVVAVLLFCVRVQWLLSSGHHDADDLPLHGGTPLPHLHSCYVQHSAALHLQRRDGENINSASLLPAWVCVWQTVWLM